MIRINLLGIKKEVKGVRAPAVSLEGAKLTAMVLAFVGLAVAALAGHFFVLSGKARELDVKIVEEEKRKTDLAQVKAQYDESEKLRQLLKKKIDIIEGLQRAQTGPVEILGSLANTVQAAGTLWLTSFENTGNKVSLEGVAGSVNAVADFIGHLKRTGYFKNVEIKEAFQDDRLKDVTTFVFQLSAEIVLPGATAAAPKPKT